MGSARPKIREFNDNGQPICGAKKKNGDYCRSIALKPNGRCRLHGGLSPRGVASARYKSGRYSMDIPARLSQRYNEGRNDPELLSLREEIALTHARMSELLKKVDTKESGMLWKKARDTYKDLRAAISAQDASKMTACLLVLDETLSEGVSDYSAWEKVFSLVEQRRKLSESERKRLIDMRQIITVERAMAMIGAISGIIRKHVTDKVILAKIANDIRVVVTGDVASKEKKPPDAADDVVDMEA